MASPTDEFKPLADALRYEGWYLGESAFEPSLVDALARECRRLDAVDALGRAGVGQGRDHVITRLRGDRTRWLESGASPVQAAFLARMESIRQALNRDLMLGLERYEAHYAIYPPGGFYVRHRDRFRDDDTRVLSTVLYLNEDWSLEDGGAMRLYLADGGHVDVTPRAGTLALFLSSEFEHEVLAPTRERLSIAGWMRRRPLDVPGVI